MSNDIDESEVDRWYVCVTCGSLIPEERFQEGDCTCLDCYEEGKSVVNWKKADDGDGFVMVGDSS